MHIKTQKWSRDERGFTVIQLCIAMAVMATLSTFAIMGLTRAKHNLRLQSSVRQLASYLEKARLDAIKRHGTSSVVFSDASTYVVTMDWGSGVAPRSFPFESGISVVSSELPNVSFNWRGRTQSCTTRFTVQNTPGEQNWVAVSDAGDVTVNADVDMVASTASYQNVSGTSDVSSTAVVSGSTVHNNAADCIDETGGDDTGTLTGTGPACGGNDTVTPSSTSIRKAGGSSKQIVVTPSSTGTITVQAPINFNVTPTTQAVTAGVPTTFTVVSNNNARSTFAINFNTPCTTLTVLMTVIN